MTKDDESLLWIAATRYHMGRTSYAVQEFCALLIKEWKNIDHRTRSIIITDVLKEIDRDNIARTAGRDHLPLGMDMDRAQWEKVRKIF
jgi:hypothetical protein